MSWSVQVWWGSELNMPETWFWWSDHRREADALNEQQRMEYFHGCPAQMVERRKRKTNNQRK